MNNEEKFKLNQKSTFSSFLAAKHKFINKTNRYTLLAMCLQNWTFNADKQTSFFLSQVVWWSHVKLYVVSKFQKISFNYKLRRVCRFLQIQKAQIIVLKIPFAFTRSIPSAYGNFNTSRIKMEQFIFSV